MKFGIVLLVIIGSVSMGLATAGDIYPFSTLEQHQRFNNVTQQLRCLVCQDEDLADSNAPLALDLRRQVYRMVKEGHSNQEIRNYMVERYGDFVLFIAVPIVV